MLIDRARTGHGVSLRDWIDSRSLENETHSLQGRGYNTLLLCLGCYSHYTPPLNYTIAWLNIPMPQKKRCCRRRRGKGFGEALGIHLYKLSFTVESSTMKTWKLNSSLVRFRWEIPEYFGWQWTTDLCKYPRMAEQGVQSVANINNTDKLSLSLNKEVNTACATLLDRRAPLKISLLWH